MPFVTLLQSNVPNSAAPVVNPGGGYSQRLMLMGIGLLPLLVMFLG